MCTGESIRGEFDARVAALDLGYSSVGVEYCATYRWRFAGLFYLGDARAGMRSAVDVITQSKSVLRSEIPEVHAARLNELLRGVSQIDEYLQEGEETGSLPGLRQEFGMGPCFGAETFGKLKGLLRISLERVPRLAVWVRLGQAFGHVLLDAVKDVDPPTMEQGISALKVCMTEIPEPLRRQLPAIQAFIKEPWPTGLGKLERRMIEAAGLGIRFRRLRQHAPASLIPGSLESLFRRTRSDLVEAAAQRLFVDRSVPDKPQLVLDGHGYEVDLDQARAVEVLLDYPSEFLTGAQIRELGNIIDDRLDRLMGRLPEPVRVLIQTKASPGGGYRLLLEESVKRPAIPTSRKRKPHNHVKNSP